MRNLTFCLLATLSITSTAQEDIEQYLLTDSLEINSLLERNVLLDQEQEGPEVITATKLGLMTKQYSNLGDLNSSLLSAGFSKIAAASLGWIFGSQVDVGDHISVGTTIFSNALLNRYNEGVTGSSKYTFLSVLIDLSYKKAVGGLQIAPGLGFGFSQNYLSLKPNGRKEMDWDDIYQNDGLMLTVRQIDFALSTDISIIFLLPKKSDTQHSITLKTGGVFHPFSFLKPGVYSGDGNSVKLNNAPSLNSTGLHLMLIWS
ncbi:MAG: hypothetical protein ISR87_08290 [Candidatus Marinimicrobia bacterium]|nr:hypothetical protein [FCB group bacterium]MBL7025443.1 hypothetical protein [Candidatus Neomarinimicrobiota bacterium]